MASLSFPAGPLEACFRKRILALFKETDPRNEVSGLAVRFCHRAADGEHAPWAGFRGVFRELRAALAAGESPKPTLILGFHALERVRGRPEAALLDWAGAAYVRYDASDDELRAAVGKIISGFSEPPPQRLLSDLREILNLVFEVRHWLQNRLLNADGAVADLDSIIRGEGTLHESYLRPVEAISRQHQRMLKQLLSLEAVVACLAPRVGGLQAVRMAVDEFEARWVDLEHARCSLRGCPDYERAGALAYVRDQYIRVRQSLLSAIAAVDGLDGALKQEQE